MTPYLPPIRFRLTRRTLTWPNDAHWSPQGHQWAAEALLEWLRGNQGACDDEG